MNYPFRIFKLDLPVFAEHYWPLCGFVNPYIPFALLLVAEMHVFYHRTSIHSQKYEVYAYFEHSGWQNPTVFNFQNLFKPAEM